MTTPQQPDEPHEQRLDDALDRLPRELEPPSDAWPAVRARLAPRSRQKRAPFLVIVAAAAAVLLLTTSVLLFRSPSERPLLTPVANVDTSGGARLLSELRAELEARRDVLSPETIRIVEENLRAINIAIAQTAQALADDPGNVQLELMLTKVTRQRDEFVRETTSMVSDL